MRTIDFRGKAVGSGRWIHGDLVWMGRQPAIFEYADFENGCVTIQEKTLGMNTGLRDKNNHEIYGGDILAHNGRVIGHVVDGVRGYCFDVVYADPVSTSTWSLYGVVVNDYEGDVEIVGNIYDNPEVVKGGTQCVPDKQEKYSMLSIHSSRTIGTVTRGLLFVRFSHARTHACSMLLISHTNMRKGMHRYRQSL